MNTHYPPATISQNVAYSRPLVGRSNPVKNKRDQVVAHRRRLLLGWIHQNDDADSMEHGKIWCEVNRCGYFMIYDQDFNRSEKPGEVRFCGMANFTMCRMFHPYWAINGQPPGDTVKEDKATCRHRWRVFTEDWKRRNGLPSNDDSPDEGDDSDGPDESDEETSDSASDTDDDGPPLPLPPPPPTESVRGRGRGIGRRRGRGLAHGTPSRGARSGGNIGTSGNRGSGGTQAYGSRARPALRSQGGRASRHFPLPPRGSQRPVPRASSSSSSPEPESTNTRSDSSSSGSVSARVKPEPTEESQSSYSSTSGRTSQHANAGRRATSNEDAVLAPDAGGTRSEQSLERDLVAEIRAMNEEDASQQVRSPHSPEQGQDTSRTEENILTSLRNRGERDRSIGTPQSEHTTEPTQASEQTTFSTQQTADSTGGGIRDRDDDVEMANARPGDDQDTAGQPVPDETTTTPQATAAPVPSPRHSSDVCNNSEQKLEPIKTEDPIIKNDPNRIPGEMSIDEDVSFVSERKLGTLDHPFTLDDYDKPKKRTYISISDSESESDGEDDRDMLVD